MPDEKQNPQFTLALLGPDHDVLYIDGKKVMDLGETMLAVDVLECALEHCGIRYSVISKDSDMEAPDSLQELEKLL